MSKKHRPNSDTPDAESLKALLAEDLSGAESLTPEKLSHCVGGVAPHSGPTHNLHQSPVLSSMETKLESAYSTYAIGQTGPALSAQELDAQVEIAAETYVKSGHSLDATSESGILQHLENVDGITVGKQIENIDANIRNEGQVLEGFLPDSGNQLVDAFGEAQGLAKLMASAQGGVLTNQQESQIVLQAEHDNGMVTAMQSQMIAHQVQADQQWSSSYNQGTEVSAQVIDNDVLAQVQERGGIDSVQEVHQIVSEVERSTGISLFVGEKESTEQVMSDYIQYANFDTKEVTLKESEIKQLEQQDLSNLPPGELKASQVEAMLSQQVENQTGITDAKNVLANIVQHISSDEKQVGSSSNILDSAHPSEVIAELSGYAEVIGALDPNITSSEMSNEVRRAYENFKGITYDMIKAQVNSELAKAIVENNSFLGHGEAVLIEKNLSNDIKATVAEDQLDIDGSRAQQILGVASSVEEAVGITTALDKLDAYENIESGNPFKMYKGVSYLDPSAGKAIEITAAVGAGMVAGVALAAAGAAAIGVGAAAGAGAITLDSAATTATFLAGGEAADRAATGFRGAASEVSTTTDTESSEVGRSLDGTGDSVLSGGGNGPGNEVSTLTGDEMAVTDFVSVESAIDSQVHPVGAAAQVAQELLGKRSEGLMKLCSALDQKAPCNIYEEEYHSLILTGMETLKSCTNATEAESVQDFVLKYIDSKFTAATWGINAGKHSKYPME